MKKIIAVLIGGLLFAGMITMLESCLAEADASQPDTTWEDTCQEKGECYIPAGGKPQPLAGVGKPWEKMCPSNDGWCPSILEGVDAGTQWCQKGKCSKKHPQEAFAIWQEWYPWLEGYCGGQPGLWPAQTIRTEAYVGKGEHGVFAMTTSGTLECGLASVDRKHAAGLDVNACDPRANLWTTCWYRNNRLIKMREKLAALDNPLHLEKAPIEDQWLLAGAGGAVGSGKVILLIQQSNALKEDADGNLIHASPYDRVLRYIRGLHGKWKRAVQVKNLAKTMGVAGALGALGYTEQQWKYLEPHADLYTSHGEWKQIFGYRPGRTAFRIARGEAVVQLIAPLYGGTIPWGEPVLPPRPDGLYTYPGDKLHCACGNWPELKDQRPTPGEYATAFANLGDDAPMDPAMLEE